MPTTLGGAILNSATGGLLDEEVGNFHLGMVEKFDKVAGETRISGTGTRTVVGKDIGVTDEEAGGGTATANASSASDAMDVVVDVGGEVVVDDVFNIRDIETTTGDVRRDEH